MRVMAMRQAIEADAAARRSRRRETCRPPPRTPKPPHVPRANAASTPQSTPARKPSAPAPAAPTRQPLQGRARTTRRCARSRCAPPRCLAIAASLAFFILWVASPGRPPVESERASGGAAPPTTVPPTPAPVPTPASPGTGTRRSAPPRRSRFATAGGEVSLLANGEIRGLDGLDASNRSAIAARAGERTSRNNVAGRRAGGIGERASSARRCNGIRPRFAW